MAHDFEYERTALLALGVLSSKESEEVKQHMLSCPLCIDEYVALRDAASSVALAVDGEGYAIELRLARIKKKLSLTIRAQAPVSHFTQPVYDTWYRAAAAASIVLALGMAGWSFSLHDRLSRTQSALVRSEHERVRALQSADLAQERLALVLAPDAKRYENASGSVITHGGRIYVALSRLPELPAGHVFQAWTLAPHARLMAPQGTFTSDADGHAFVALPSQVGQSLVVAVSIEPLGGSVQPTTKPVFVQQLNS